MAQANSIGILPSLPVVEGVEFRWMPGNPRYCVGSDGSIWSRCKPTLGFFRDWRKLRTPQNPNGYFRVDIRRTGGPAKTMTVHRLVLEAFVGKRQAGQVARHLNGNKTDNRLDNLKWGTQLENEADKDRHGTRPCGDLCRQRRLCAADIPLIFEQRLQGRTFEEVAKHFHVGVTAIQSVVYGKTWRATAAGLRFVGKGE